MTTMTVEQFDAALQRLGELHKAQLEGKKIIFDAFDDLPERTVEATKGIECYCPAEVLRQNFRVKPEPVEGWVNVYESGIGCTTYATKKLALGWAGQNALRTVRVREVEE